MRILKINNYVVNLSAQIISVALFALCAYFLPESDFSQYVKYTAFAAIIAVLSTLSLENSLLQKDISAELRKNSLSFLCAVLAACIVLTGLIARLLGFDNYLLLCLMVFVVAYRKIISALVLMTGELKFIYRMNLCLAVSPAFGLLGYFFLGNVFWFILFLSIYSLATITVVFYVIYYSLNRGEHLTIGRFSVGGVFKRNFDFIVNNSLSNWMSTLVSQGMVLVLDMLYGPAVVASYGLFQRGIITPLNSLVAVASHKYQYEYRTSVLTRDLIYSRMLLSFVLTLALLSVSYVYASYLHGLIFQEKYIYLDSVISHGSLIVLAIVVFSPMHSLLSINRRNGYVLIYKIVNLLILYVAAITAVDVGMFLLVVGFGQLISGFMIFRAVKNYVK